ncbi:hypothetical protein [Luteolibacter sp. Populi]|uniref:hypothetical protein n=1 Tax=Luteolibacter sp. Populi TaxID=3230487 RepID=UPI0034663D3A
MNYLLIALLIVIAGFSFRSDKLSNPASLRMAWIWFACVPFTNAATAVLRVGSFRDAGDIALVEIWSIGFQWLFLGLSILALAKAIIPSPEAPRAIQRS